MNPQQGWIQSLPLGEISELMISIQEKYKGLHLLIISHDMELYPV